MTPTTRTYRGHILTLVLVDPSNGNSLWHAEATGRNYIRVARTGRWCRARLGVC